MHRVTLKDISERCGVTPTLVSAVLNNRHGHIMCSAQRRKKILAVARELGYRPNVLARCMAGKQVPIIGLMMHYSESDTALGIDSFVHQFLARFSFQMNRVGLEVLFIPYSSENEQLERLESLYKNSLIGGIISNIIPDSHERICAYLSSSSLPYMILGYPRLPEVFCVYTQSRHLDDILLKSAELRGFSRVYQLGIQDAELCCRPMPFVNDYIWHTPSTPYGELFPQQTEIFFAVMGIKVLRQLETLNIQPANYMLVESEEYAPLLSARENLLLVSDSLVNAQIEYASKSLLNWFHNAEKPPVSAQVFDDQISDIAIFKRMTVT